MMKLPVIAVLLVLAAGIRAARILGVFPLPSKSHQVVYDPIMLELAKRGHQVVMITVYPLEYPPENLTQIDISFTSGELKKRLRYADFQDKSPIYFLDEYSKIYSEIFQQQMEVPEIQKLLADEKEHFDLLIMSGTPLMFGFKHRFKSAPVIAAVPLPSDHRYVGSPTHPILYPEIISLKLYDLNILDKVKRTFDFVHHRYMDWANSFSQNRIAKKYFGDDLPDLLQLKQNIDLLFVNANPLITGIRPETPTVVHIDGIHMKPKKALPKDLQEYLDNSSQGVVYMSLGSNVQSKDLSNETLDMLKDAFSEIPYNILWKFEDDTLPDKPENVLIRKWLPQQDLLGHKNIKAFIFQGGMQSFDEAIRDKVPLICMPFAIDQIQNAQRVEKMKLGLRFLLKEGTKEALKAVIMNVTTEPMYKQNMIQLSKLVSDKPLTPLENAIWWTEYVLRHKGAKHLRSPAADASYTEYFMIDVLGVILALFFAVIILLTLLLRRVWVYLKIVLKRKRKTA